MYNFYKIKNTNLKMLKTIYGEQYVLAVNKQFVRPSAYEQDEYKTVTLAWLPKFLYFGKDKNYRIFKVKKGSKYDEKLQSAITNLTDPWGFVKQIEEPKTEAE